MSVAIKSSFGYFTILLGVVVLAQLARTSPLPQEDETETEDTIDEEEDEYDEEENTTVESSTVAEDEEEYEEDEDPIKVKEEDDGKDEKEDAAAREKLANRLGIKNFSSAAIADKASNLVITYLTGQRAPIPLPFPKRPKPTGPRVITTKKYRLRRPTTTTKEPTVITSPLKEVTKTNGTNKVRTFLLTVPHGVNGSESRTIEINIPMDMMMMRNQSIEMEDGDFISPSDDLGVKNIEAAIMEALLIAQKMAVMSATNAVMALMNVTEKPEVDITSTELPENITKLIDSKAVEEAVNLILESTSIPPQQEVAHPEVETISQPSTEDPSTRRPTRRRRVRSTTTIRPANPDDTFGAGPATDVVVSQIRNGVLPQFLWTSIMKLANSKYTQIAVDAVECQVFYYCPNDTELGTLTKGAKF